MYRRDFLKAAGIGAGALITVPAAANSIVTPFSRPTAEKPIVISTWEHGLAANDMAFSILNEGGPALDAVEKGVMVTESDPNSRSVGYGGRPDRDGNVTLDACIMNFEGDCGAVAFLQHIENPIAVARKVMEDTPHVMLVGEGALQFALAQGFKKKNLLVARSREEWESWVIESQYKPVINTENHDTIGMLALDADGNLAGACTTSGAAYKMHGRVGDSPIIGAGLFVDNEVGAACATGLGEAVIRVAGSAMVVEQMRNGKSPEEACKIVCDRIIKNEKNLDGLQVGFLALDKNGNHGGYSIYNGFNYARASRTTGNEMVDVSFDRKWD